MTFFSWPRGRHMGAFAIVAACAACSSSSSPDDSGKDTVQTHRIRASTIDKVDLLLAVDNSFSMGDKQGLLAEAIPDLLGRLFTPRCVDEAGAPTGASADASGKCATGKAEFAPIHDLHVGIVSSALGSFADICPKTVPENDDRGHLLARVAEGSALTKPSNFLTWLPDTPENQGKKPVAGATREPSAESLAQDTSRLLRGAGSHGCGYEAQLESVYRFLVQPDPFETAERDASETTVLRGVDEDILKQRHDFLRPDSLVAIIMLTDENESTIDPRALGGRAWSFQSSQHVQGGTAACAANPNDAACTSCLLRENANLPECKNALDPEQDAFALRFFEMKRRFGTDVRFPIERYVRGFRDARVPNRDGEHPGGSFDYAGDAQCTNPIFARDLPKTAPADASQLCQLSRGPRTPDMVLFTLIGGVPWQLLTSEPTKFTGNAAPLKNALDDADWKRILGADPFHYDFTGIDPHMRESVGKREGLTLPDDALPREWDTRAKDLQYACTFPLPAPRDCTVAAAEGCECIKDRDTGVQSDSSVCDPARPSMQLRGKAYPSVSELAVAKALGPQAVVASICPRTLDKKSPDYGYRPAIGALAQRMTGTLDPDPCLASALPVQENGNATCTLLELLPAGDPATACDPAKGLEQPEAGALARFREHQQADGADAASLAFPVCALKQLPRADFVEGSCESSPASGWCYTTRATKPAAKCEQAVRFSASGRPAPGAVVELQCSPQAI